MRILLSILLLFLLAGTGYAQSSKKKKKSSAEQPSPTSVNPGAPSQAYGPKKSSKKKSASATHDAERDYYERKEELAKTRRKNEKMMDKPQYSDPLYFGHKKPPKKRPPNKMKYCKECGLRH